MPYSLDGTGSGLRLRLEGAVTILDANDLAACVLRDLGEGQRVRVDARRAGDVDTAVLQLLCSLQRSTAALSFEDPSVAFLAAVDRCGLRRQLLNTREGA